MCDSYKNIINSLKSKKEIIAFVPFHYANSEFGTEFAQLLKFNSSQNRFGKIFSFISAVRELAGIVSNQNVNKIFMYFDNCWINLFLILALRDRNIQYYLWVHDPDLHLGERRIAILLRKIMSRIVFPNIHQFIVSYREGKEILVDKHRIPAGKISVIHLPEMLELEFEDLKIKELSIPNYDYDFIFFGRLEEYKGINILLDAVKQINSKSTIVKLLIVGRGNIETDIQKEASLISGVTFLNEYVENRQLAEYIIRSRIVILPYVTATGSQTVQVANYYNKPVIATRVGCFTEYITNYKNGLFIEDISSNGIIEAIEKIKNVQVYVDIKKRIPTYFNENFNIKKTCQSLNNLLMKD
jgi:Glycosyltransferase